MILRSEKLFYCLSNLDRIITSEFHVVKTSNEKERKPLTLEFEIK